jgi:hypothetical protein
MLRAALRRGSYALPRSARRTMRLTPSHVFHTSLPRRSRLTWTYPCLPFMGPLCTYRVNSHRNGRVAVRAPVTGSIGPSVRERTYIDPLWHSDQHGLLVKRIPSGELQGHVPTSIYCDGPCSLVTPVAEDGSDLRRGASVPNRKYLAMLGATVTPRLLARFPTQDLQKGTRVGLVYSLLAQRPLTRRRK